MYTVKGKIKVINQEFVVSEKFKKREFVIETEGEYPQLVLLQTAQDNTILLDSYNEGDYVSCMFNLRGREWTSPKDGEVRYFNTLDCWKIDLANIETKQEESSTSKEEVAQEDDLPF
jgi:hypothetical protein